MPIDLTQLLNTAGGSILNRLLGAPSTTSPTLTQYLSDPRNLLGLGLTTGGLLSREEPGDVTQTRQFLRSAAVDPGAISALIGQETAPIAAAYEPLLAQQRANFLNEAQARIAPGLPQSVGVGIGGPEIASIKAGIEQNLAPAERAFLADASREAVGRRLQAAESLLRSSQPDQLGAILAALGANLLTTPGGIGGGLTTPGVAGARPQGLVGTDGATLPISGAASVLNALRPAQVGAFSLFPNEASSLTNLLGLTSTAAMGQPAAQTLMASLQAAFPGQAIGALEEIGNGAVALLDQGGNVIGTVGANGQIINQTTGQEVGQAATGKTGGLLGSQMAGSPLAQSLAMGATAIGSGVVGYQVGKAVGDAIEQPNTKFTTLKTAAGGAVSGAASGAAAGAALLGGPGALIGAFVGGIAGLFGGAGAEKRRESAQREAEAQSTGARRPHAESLLQQLDANVAQLPQARQQATQIEPIVQQLLDANDPVVRQITQQLIALSSSGAPFKAPNGNAIADQLHPPAPYFLNALVSRAFDTGQSIAVNRQNPESLVGRIYSEETGKFDSAYTSLIQAVNEVETAKQLWQQLLQRLGGA